MAVFQVMCLLALAMCASALNVHEVNAGNFEEFIRGKFFTLTFVDSPSCTRCHVLYPFFVQAAQVFKDDPEIFLARTHDKSLTKEWEVDELPALIYHLHGKNEHHVMMIDITVDDIVDMIARLLHGNFAGLRRGYTVVATADNYKEIVETPRQSVLLLIHGNKKGKKELESMEKVAFNFRKDDAILFVTLNVNKYEKLRNDSFKTREVPTLMWFEADKKDKPKRFGSFLSVEMITMFVNEKTGLNRDTDGGILDEAGRVPEADAIIEKNIASVANANGNGLSKLAREIAGLKSGMEDHQVEMLDYYLFVLDNVAMTGNIAMLKELLAGEEEKLYGMDDIATKERETLKRRRNIIKYLQAEVKDFKDNKNSRLPRLDQEEEVSFGRGKKSIHKAQTRGHDSGEL